MKAVMIEKPWDIKNVERDIPEIKDGEALIKVKAVGICGSDIGAFRGSNNLVSYPRVIGHEIAGEIVAISRKKLSQIIRQLETAGKSI